jgi:hypothetical protein
MLLIANELGLSNCKGDAITAGGEANRASGAIIFPGLSKRSTIHSLERGGKRPTALIREPQSTGRLFQYKEKPHHPEQRF